MSGRRMLGRWGVVGVVLATMMVAVLPAGATRTITEDAVVVSQEPSRLEFFGNSVDVSGDRMVVGVLRDFTFEDTPGSAYVYTRTRSGWSSRAALGVPGAEHTDGFGWSVAISGKTVIVGSPFEGILPDGAELAGAVYIYELEGSEWVRQARLTSPDPACSTFGLAVDVEGGTAVVVCGASGAYVFERAGSDWTYQTTLVASDGASFPTGDGSVDISGDTLAIGKYVFAGSGSTWSEQAILEASDGAPIGNNVAISGDTLVMGAPGDSEAGTSAGAAVVFTRSGTEWTEQAKLIASDAEAIDGFGSAVAVAGGTIVVGAANDVVDGIRTGSTYLFRSTRRGWREAAMLSTSDQALVSRHGWSVAMSNRTIAVGAPGTDLTDSLDDEGAVYIYEYGSR